MNKHKKTARVVGILLIACTGATIISLSFTAPILDSPDYLTRLADNETRVIVGTLFEFVWAATCASIAIALYPLLKRSNELLALASVGFRIAEGVFVLIGTLFLLSLFTLSQELVIAGDINASSIQTSGTLLMTMRDWVHNVILLVAFNLGAMIYTYLLYQTRLIPRWLSGWGIIGNVISLVAIGYYVSTHDLGLTHTLLNAPIAVQEMVFAVWLIVKGFNSSTITPASAKK